MNLEEIKSAVKSGQTVHWANSNYRVIQSKGGGWLVICDDNQHCIGLTHRDGVTMNGEPEDFFLSAPDARVAAYNQMKRENAVSDIKMDMQGNPRLRAISGDVVGMGATGANLDRPLTRDCYQLVHDFLVMQTLASLEFMTENVHEEKRYHYERARGRLGWELIDAGIFKSKYDIRTTWMLVEDD